MQGNIVFQDDYVTLYNCDAVKFYDLGICANMIFADPPFGMDISQFEDMLFGFGTYNYGHTFLMSNERHLAKYIVKYDEYFRRLFAVDIVVANNLSSKIPMQQTDFIAEFRPLGAENNKFVNRMDYFTTLITSRKDRRKAANNASQNVDKSNFLFHQFITHYTVEGDTILDPFCGSGKLLLEARRLKRKAIGFEINEQSARKAAMLLGQKELF